jgi:ketosteroid isomerase-like protein
MKNWILPFAITLCLTAPAIAQDDRSTAESLAREYMAHYSAVDWDSMETFLAEDVVFSDPTALGADLGPDGIQHTGRTEAMSMLREFSQQYQPIELGFVWDTVFESNGRVVFMGHVNALYPTEQDGQVFRWRAEQVTVITVRDGEIIRHDDFANYAGPEQGLIAVE